LKNLIKLAELEKNLVTQIRADATFAANWAITKDWGPESRYKLYLESEAKDFITSISNANNGILKWIKQFW
jgi:hypothetical protein